MPLDDVSIRNAKPAAKPFKLTDEKGLYLLVNPLPAGSKLWRLKYRIAGKEKLLALGSYPDISLKNARLKRDAARLAIKDGRDPSFERKAAKRVQALQATNAFEVIAKDFLARRAATWSPRYKQTALTRLENHIFPALGRRPIGQIEPPELLAELRKIEARGAHEMATRLLRLCSQIFRFAIACGVCTRDAAADLRGALTRSAPSNVPVIPIEEYPQLLRLMDASEEAPYCRDRQTRIALQLIALTFVRTGELRKALWSQVDWSERIWMPAIETMKMRRPHMVPLAPQAITLLEELREFTGSSRFLFPGEGKKGLMSENTILYSLYALGYRDRMCGHGFRSLASTILNEAGFDEDWIELQLAHVQKNKVRRAYNHAKYLDQRRKMMAWYADYLDELRKGDFVKAHHFRPQSQKQEAA
jgi:integrase